MIEKEYGFKNNREEKLTKILWTLGFNSWNGFVGEVRNRLNEIVLEKYGNEDMADNYGMELELFLNDKKSLNGLCRKILGKTRLSENEYLPFRNEVSNALREIKNMRDEVKRHWGEEAKRSVSEANLSGKDERERLKDNEL